VVGGTRVDRNGFAARNTKWMGESHGGNNRRRGESLSSTL
jgi:hypothetical protein